MSKNEAALKLVLKYCKSYGIEITDLFHKYKGVPAKKIKGVHVDYMRMCLGFYLEREFRMTTVATAKMIGYGSHASVSHNRSKIEQFIKNGDPYLFPYYERLLEVAA